MIDSYLLHGPTHTCRSGPADWAAWGAMEDIHDSWQAPPAGDQQCQPRTAPRSLSATPAFGRASSRTVAMPTAAGTVSPAILRRQRLVYQGFSLLTANREDAGPSRIGPDRQGYGRAISQIVFRFALDVGMLPLTGTTDINHMQADLGVLNFHLEPNEIRQIEKLGADLSLHCARLSSSLLAPFRDRRTILSGEHSGEINAPEMLVLPLQRRLYFTVPLHFVAEPVGRGLPTWVAGLPAQASDVRLRQPHRAEWVP